MANIWDIAISILVGNFNSGLSYLITTVPPWWKKTFNIAATLRSSPICVESGLATVQMMVLRVCPNSGLSNLSWGRRLSGLKGTQIQLSHYWAPRACSFQGKITKNRGWTGRFLAIFNDTMIIFGTTRCVLLSNSTFHVTWGTSMTSTSHFFKGQLILKCLLLSPNQQKKTTFL